MEPCFEEEEMSSDYSAVEKFFSVYIWGVLGFVFIMILDI